MKIYVASHSKEAAQDAAACLRRNGHDITSRWYDEEFLPTESYTVERRQQIAIEDVADVAAADALVLIAGPEKYSGGKFVEAGVAIGQNKPVYVLGRRENMLLWHPVVRDFWDLI